MPAFLGTLRRLALTPSLRQVTFNGILSASPWVASQTLFSMGAMVTGAPSEPPVETGKSAIRRGLGIS